MLKTTTKSMRLSSTVTGTININTFARFTLTEVKELVYEGFGKVTPEKWQSLVNHTEKVENHYWEADGLNEELLERFIITNSDSESSDDEGVNEGFSDADSTSFGSRSESTDSSDDEVGII